MKCAASKKSRRLMRWHLRRYKRHHARRQLILRLGPNRALAYRMLNDRSQWGCLNALWYRESKWSVTADNPKSSAYGIPQALPGSKMGAGWQSSAYVQIRWGLGYIRGRYGTPCNADRFQRRNNWY